MGLSATRAGTDSYVLADGVRAVSLAGRSLVHVERRRQVFELNDTAERIWRVLAAGRSASEAAAEIAAPGLSSRQALDFVTQAAAEWVAAGCMAPRALADSLASRRAPDRTLVLDDLVVDLHVGDVGAEELDAAFGHLFGPGEGARRRLTIIEHARQLLFYLERDLVFAGGRDGLVAHVKALLTELYLDVVDDGFLAHGALLLDGERPLMLSGEPGAGKTTLALALAAAGWRYGGDDIVRIRADGAAWGVPFAAAVKSGSLPLLSRSWPQLEALPDWVRADGQKARYLTPDLAGTPPRPLSAFVTLARRNGGGARVRPITAVEALRALMDSAYAERWRMTGDAFCALAGSLERAVCVQLEYCDLDAAVDAIGGIAGVQAQVA